MVQPPQPLLGADALSPMHGCPQHYSGHGAAATVAARRSADDPGSSYMQREPLTSASASSAATLHRQQMWRCSRHSARLPSSTDSAIMSPLWLGAPQPPPGLQAAPRLVLRADSCRRQQQRHSERGGPSCAESIYLQPWYSPKNKDGGSARIFIIDTFSQASVLATTVCMSNVLLLSLRAAHLCMQQRDAPTHGAVVAQQQHLEAAQAAPAHRNAPARHMQCNTAAWQPGPTMLGITAQRMRNNAVG